MINISKYCEAELYAQVRKRKKYTGMAEAEAKVKAVMSREKWAKSRVLNGGGRGIPLKKTRKMPSSPHKFFVPNPPIILFLWGDPPHLKCARDKKLAILTSNFGNFACGTWFLLQSKG